MGEAESNIDFEQVFDRGVELLIQLAFYPQTPRIPCVSISVLQVRNENAEDLLEIWMIVTLAVRFLL